MVVEKRKSQGNMGGVATNTPPKKGNFNNQKSPFQKSPQGGGGQQKGSPFGGQKGNSPGGKPNQHKKNSFGGGGKPNKGSPQKGKGVPPPPPQGAAKLNVQVVPSAVKQEKAPKVKSENKHNKNANKGKKGDKQKNGLGQVSEASKAIKRGHKRSRARKMNDKLDMKPRPPGACEKALKLEKELGHTGGRVYSVKIADPPLSQEIIKSWSSGIETAVFSRPVEPRHFLVVFKHNANVKKELETLKKVKFAGSNIQVEEKLDTDSHIKSHPEAIDPFSLYVTNLHDSVTKEKLKELFPKAALITQTRKHSPKLGNTTKFAFVNFDKAEDAISSFRENYSAVLSGNSIVMRFRRVTAQELSKVHQAAEPKAALKKVEQKTKSAPTPTPQQPKKQPVKPEPKSEEEDDDDDEDEDDDDDDEMEVGNEEEDDDDDDEDDDEEEDDEEDDDDDDDDESDE